MTGQLSDRETIETIRESRESLEALADTELPASLWARRLLRLLDDHDDGGGGDAT